MYVYLISTIAIMCLNLLIGCMLHYDQKTPRRTISSSRTFTEPQHHFESQTKPSSLDSNSNLRSHNLMQESMPSSNKVILMINVDNFDDENEDQELTRALSSKDNKKRKAEENPLEELPNKGPFLKTQNLALSKVQEEEEKQQLI